MCCQTAEALDGVATRLEGAGEAQGSAAGSADACVRACVRAFVRASLSVLRLGMRACASLAVRV